MGDGRFCESARMGEAAASRIGRTAFRYHGYSLQRLVGKTVPYSRTAGAPYSGASGTMRQRDESHQPTFWDCTPHRFGVFWKFHVAAGLAPFPQSYIVGNVFCILRCVSHCPSLLPGEDECSISPTGLWNCSSSDLDFPAPSFVKARRRRSAMLSKAAAVCSWCRKPAGARALSISSPSSCCARPAMVPPSWFRHCCR